MFKVAPNDPIIVEMDPVQKLWFFNQWLGDQEEKAELAKNHAYLLASFTNPEAVKRLLNDNKHISTEEDFEESSNMVRDFNLKSLQQGQGESVRERRKKRKMLSQIS
jgi:hypothetical protein